MARASTTGISYLAREARTPSQIVYHSFIVKSIIILLEISVDKTALLCYTLYMKTVILYAYTNGDRTNIVLTMPKVWWTRCYKAKTDTTRYKYLSLIDREVTAVHKESKSRTIHWNADCIESHDSVYAIARHGVK